MRGEQETNCLTRVKQNLGRNSVHYFCSDPQKIIRILKSARPNPAQSNFPDFLFENGFIEHFQITASRETRKGAEHRQRQAQFCKEAEQRFQRMGRELNDDPPANSLTREICEMEAPPYSYEMYEASFRKNWQHHINSLKSISVAVMSVFSWWSIRGRFLRQCSTAGSQAFIICIKMPQCCGIRQRTKTCFPM